MIEYYRTFDSTDEPGPVKLPPGDGWKLCKMAECWNPVDGNGYTVFIWKREVRRNDR